MAFGAGVRPWVRGTLAKIAASTVTLGQAELLVDEAGGVYGGDGSTQIKSLRRLARISELGSTLGTTTLDGNGNPVVSFEPSFFTRSDGTQYAAKTPATAGDVPSVLVTLPDGRFTIVAATGVSDGTIFGLRQRGTWAAQTVYRRGDVAQIDRPIAGTVSTWLCLNPHTAGANWDPTNWVLWAAGGQTGQTGATPALSSSTPAKSSGTGGPGTGGAAPRADHFHPSPVSWGAEQQNLLAWSGDPASAAAGGATVAGGDGSTSGVAYVIRLFTPVAITVNHAYLNCTGVGSGVSGAFAAIYQGGAKLAQSTDQTSALAVGPVDFPIPAAQVAAGYFELYYWTTASTSCPLWSRGSSLAVNNIGQPANAYRFGKADTGLTTTAPANRAALTKILPAIWAAVGA